MSEDTPERGFTTFLIVWATQSLSVIGSAIAYFALIIYLTRVLYPGAEQQLELALGLSAMALASAVPTLVVAPVAGSVVDRVDRKTVMMLSGVANGLASILLLVLLVMGVLNLVWVVVVVSLFAFFNAFHGAAFDASYVYLVRRELLPRANGMMQTMWSLAAIVAPGVAAVLISLPVMARSGIFGDVLGRWLGRMADGTILAIGVDAVTFFIMAAALLFVVVPSPPRTQARPNLLGDVKLGIHYIIKQRSLLWLLSVFMVANLAVSPLQVFQPLMLRFNLAADAAARGMTFEAALALLATLGGLGGVIGGLVVSTWGGLKRNRVYGVIVPAVFAGAALICYGFSPYVYLTAVVALLLTAAVPIMNAHSQSIWQIRTPREMQGRVFAVRRVIAQLSWPVATMLAGVLGGVFNPGHVLAALGVMLVVFGVSQLFNRTLLAVESEGQGIEAGGDR